MSQSHCLQQCHRLHCFLQAIRFEVIGSFRAVLQKADSAMDRLHDAEIVTCTILFPTWAGKCSFPIPWWGMQHVWESSFPPHTLCLGTLLSDMWVQEKEPVLPFVMKELRTVWWFLQYWWIKQHCSARLAISHHYLLGVVRAWALPKQNGRDKWDVLRGGWEKLPQHTVNSWRAAFCTGEGVSCSDV